MAELRSIRVPLRGLWDPSPPVGETPGTRSRVRPQIGPDPALDLAIRPAAPGSGPLSVNQHRIGTPPPIPHKQLIQGHKTTAWQGPNRRRSGLKLPENSAYKSKAYFRYGRGPRFGADLHPPSPRVQMWKGFLAKIRPDTKTRAVAAFETLRAAASGPISATAKG
jgi:hypothetical protein